jgi:biofilm PGA synthesis N-glycosyltransferase PgaC
MIDSLLFLCLGLAVYHYIGYPLAVMLWAWLAPRPGGATAVLPPSPQGAGGTATSQAAGGTAALQAAAWPSVTLLIAAYNEERVIEGKLRNALAMRYPGRLEIVVVSDGSTDRTPQIVDSFATHGVVSMHSPPRRGKTAALNRGVAAARGEILVFSDANNDFNPDALTALVRHFRDPAVGGVCGVKRIRDAAERQSSKGDGLYWRYESAIKTAEGRIGSITNADGEIFAMRRSLYRPIAEHIINDDAQITFDIIGQGQRILYEPAAQSVEYASIHIEDDFFVKVRMVAGGFQTLAHHWKKLLPPRSWFAFAFLSHKVLRYLMPLVLLLLLLTCLLRAGQPWGAGLLAAQAAFYGAAAVGYALIRRGRIPGLTYVPFYFTAMNVAAFMGLVRYLNGRQGTQWRKAQR